MITRKIGLVALLALAFAEPSKADEFKIQEYQNVPGIVMTEDLQSNPENLIINATRQSEKEGIKEMRKILSENLYEEAWLYIPNQELWVEIGKEEQFDIDEKGGHITGLSFNVENVETYNNEKELIVYHYHPEVYEEKKEDVKRELQTLEDSLTQEELKTKVWLRCDSKYIFDALPSKEDLDALWVLSYNYYTANPEGNLIFKICSKEGVTEFSLNEKGREELKEKRFRLGNDFPKLTNEYLAKLTEEKGSAYVIQELCSILTSVYKSVDISFTPYNEILSEEDSD